MGSKGKNGSTGGLKMKLGILFLLFAGMMLPAFASKTGEAGCDDGRFDYLYFEAIAREQAGQQDQAFELLRRAVEVDSLSAPALSALADYYQKLGNPEKALALMKQAVACDTANYWYGITEARLLLRMKRSQEAVDSYERLLRAFPDKDEICYELAELYLRLDSARQCLRILDRIEESEGINMQLTAHKFYIHQLLGDLDRAFAENYKLIERYPYEVSYRIANGDMLMQAGRLEEAKRNYDEAARIEPDNARLWVSLANYHTIMGNAGAADTLVRAALINPALDLETKIDILTDYLKTTLRKVSQEKAKAEDTTAINLPGVDTLFATVTTIHPTAPEVYSLQAEYLEAIGNTEAARTQMRYAVDLKPSEAAYWEKFLYMQMRADDTLQIVTTAREALRHHPSLFAGYTALGYACQLQEKWLETLEVYQQALKNIDPKNVNRISSIYGYIGDTYHRIGQMDKAYAAYDEALKYNGENYSVLNNYSYFLSLEKRDLAKAERMSSIVVKKVPDEPTYLDTYAWIYFQQGNYILARFYQEMAISKAGKEVSAALLEHYGDILYMEGKKEEALGYWQRASVLPDGASPELEKKISTQTYIESVPEWLKK